MDRKKKYKHSGFWGQHGGQTTVPPTNAVHHKKQIKKHTSVCTVTDI